MPRVRFLLTIAVAAALAGVGLWLVVRANHPSPVQLRVAAASDLKFALDELKATYTKEHPETKLEVTYGSSGTFFAQIVNKAPFDLYLSADVSYPEKLIEQGLAARESLFLYGIGKLVVWAPKGGLDVKGLGEKALTSEAAKKIAIANPQHAPYGRAAEAALAQLGIAEQVQAKLVFAENVAQAAQYAQSGAADAAFVALAWAKAPPVEGQGEFWTVPEDAYPKLEQGGVILKAATNQDAARSFRSFLLSDAARTLLQRYGFGDPRR